MSDSKVSQARCRFCDSSLEHIFVDLGMSPLCQTHIAPAQLNHMEPFYPLRAYVCDSCWLVQLEEFVAPDDIFSEYAYFSSYSDSWVEHARRYVDEMVTRFGFDTNSQVMEIASNDGYLLQHFVAKDIPVLGIEPAANIAEVAQEKGIPTTVRFFGQETAVAVNEQTGAADLLLGNNVLAHVPDLNDFVAGMKILLAASGIITMEFPHLYQLMAKNQFDTIYHEHFSYFSFIAVQRVFAAHGLCIFDVEELSTHGGSLRIFAQHDDYQGRRITEHVNALRQRELDKGFAELKTYAKFSHQVEQSKRNILTFLIEANGAGKQVVGYGAPGKGNTLLNYCGIREDFLDYTVDLNPYKQGKYTPGTHIPILNPDKIRETKPDYIFILPWNIKEEIISKHDYVKAWGGQFVVPIPEIKIVA